MTSLPELILPKREFFGLSIDRTSLRGIQLRHSGKMTAMAEAKFSEEIFSHSVLMKEEVFLAALNQLKAQGKFTTPYVVACFPEDFAYTRELTIPIVARKDLNEAVDWHVKDLFPFPEDELYVDWKIVRTTDREYNLAVVAVPKRTIDPLVKVLLSAGLKLLRLKPDASTIARLVQLKTDQHAIVTEVNRTVAYVTLVEGEKAVFTTVVPFSSDDTPASYLHNVNQTIKEIEGYYTEKGILKQGENIDIVLTGEVASDQWIKELPSHAKILTTPPRNPAFNKAYAVAVSQVSPKAEDETINLLPRYIQQQYDTERTVLYYNTILFRAVSIVGSYSVVLILILVLLMVQKRELEGSVKELTNLVQSSQKSSQNLLSVNATAKKIVELAPLRKTPYERLDQFFTLVPEGITITQWDYDDTKVLFTVSGVAATRDDLLSFKASLESSQQFTKIILPLAYLESPTQVNFTLNFNSK